MSADGFDFPPPVMPEGAEALRAEVRAFAVRSREEDGWEPNSDFGSGFDPAFSRRLGRRGWIGMTWPRAYGGGDRSALERYIVTEELLAAGAPVFAHWIADRQSGPLFLRYGTEAQRQAILPRICAGECYFAIGMSEPDSGSDLASVRTRAERTPDGWRINGSKIWSSNAHRCDFMIALFRTGPAGDDRHGGLSQFLIDLPNDGLTINPIINLAGSHEFNEVVFDNVLIPDDRLIGAEGDGWKQVTSELALERSGPERILSTFHLLTTLAAAASDDPSPELARTLGRLTSRMWALRRMSLSVAGMLDAGRLPDVEAAIVKDVGTRFERDIAEALRLALPVEPVPAGSSNARSTASMLGAALCYLPSYTLRGGTNEIMRSIIARGLGLR